MHTQTTIVQIISEQERVLEDTFQFHYNNDFYKNDLV